MRTLPPFVTLREIKIASRKDAKKNTKEINVADFALFA